MNKTSNLAIALLVLTGSAFSQDLKRITVRDDQVAFFKRGELIQRRAYQACMGSESKKPDANRYNCQFRMNAANDYARKATAARNLLKQSEIPSGPIQLQTGQGGSKL